MNFTLTSAPIDPVALQRDLTHSSAGACVAFEGWVRDHNEGQAVLALDYEAFVPLAESEGSRILDEARAKFQVVAVAGVHRVGALRIGDLAVWVGVASAHRGSAFDACRYIIDEAKARLPIWKKEHYATGASQWINCAVRGDYVASNEPEKPH